MLCPEAATSGLFFYGLVAGKLSEPKGSSKVGKRHDTAPTDTDHRHVRGKLAGSLVVGVGCATGNPEDSGSLRNRNRYKVGVSEQLGWRFRGSCECGGVRHTLYRSVPVCYCVTRYGYDSGMRAA